MNVHELVGSPVLVGITQAYNLAVPRFLASVLAGVCIKSYILPQASGRAKDGMKLQRLLIDDELDGEDVIKGFKLKVKRLFDLPNIGQPDDLN